MAEHRCDVVILGGGSGGYAAALRAAQLGLTVAIVEEDKLGGTCLHRGCVPTKALLHVAEVVDAVRSGSALGIQAELNGVDVTRMHGYRDAIVTKKLAGLTALIASRGITVVPGHGTLVDGLGIAVGEDVYRGSDVILATGSESKLAGFTVGRRIITSEEALDLPEIPERALVLGGGVIGVEFASLWRSLGADVTIIEAADHLLPGADPSISKALERAYRGRGIEEIVNTQVTAAEESDAGVTVTLSDGSSRHADYLLVAVGRAPRTAGIGADEVGVTLQRGFVVTDEHLRTSIDQVWAVGDIVAGPQLAHRSFQQAIAVAERIAGKTPAPIPDAHIPQVTYAHPEVASVGLTEPQAMDAFGPAGIVSYEYNLAGNAKSEILGTTGLAKVIRRVDGPVIGVHLIGDRVGELITEGQLAVSWDAHPEDFSALIHAHPSQSEALGEAFLALAGAPLHTR